MYCPPITIRCVDCRNFGRFILVGTHVINNVHKFFYNPPTKAAKFVGNCFFLIFFAVSRKTMVMVATAIYTVTMVLWKETAFPLCRATEKRWKMNVVARVSSVIEVIRLPISCVSSMAISCHVPAVYMTNG